MLGGVQLNEAKRAVERGEVGDLQLDLLSRSQLREISFDKFIEATGSWWMNEQTVKCERKKYMKLFESTSKHV